MEIRLWTAEEIRQLRGDYSLKEFAPLVGIHLQTLWRFENGNRPGVGALIKLTAYANRLRSDGVAA